MHDLDVLAQGSQNNVPVKVTKQNSSVRGITDEICPSYCGVIKTYPLRGMVMVTVRRHHTGKRENERLRVR